MIVSPRFLRPLWGLGFTLIAVASVSLAACLDHFHPVPLVPRTGAVLVDFLILPSGVFEGSLFTLRGEQRNKPGS